MTFGSEIRQKYEEFSYVFMRNWRQFLLLLWKNWLLQKRKIIWTVLIFLFPIGLILILVVMRSVSTFHSIPSATIYQSFFVSTNLIQLLNFPPEQLMLAYAPNTALVTRIVDRAATLMGVNISKDLGYASEAALEDYVTRDQSIFGGIVFTDSVDLSNKIIYKIRLRSKKGSSLRGGVGWKTNAMFSGYNTIGPKDINDQYGGNDPGYYKDGFLAIQWAIDLSLITELNPSFNPRTTNVTTQLKRYPYPAYSEDSLTAVVRRFLSLFILLSFVIIAPTICVEIALEKENNIKDLMKVMGMRLWLYWSSWFVKCLLFMLTTVIIMTFLLHAPITSNGPVLVYGSFAVTFVFLLLYSLSLIAFCFALSTLVCKASYAAAVGVILFILSYLPHFYLETIYNDMTLGERLAASLDFNLAMSLGCFKISQYEGLGIGLHWSNVWYSEYSGDSHAMGHILIMLLVDIVIYSILSWYLDAVIPGNLGTSQPVYFPFTRKYWMGGRENKLSDEDFETLISVERRRYFDTGVQAAKPGIQIRGLTKNFRSKSKPVVNNLNIEIYEGHITVLVGHKGSGKTTTMFMLTGFLSPSKGTAYINGFDITREMDEIGQNLGFCPQQSILFDTLTVREHLLFFAILKGSSVQDASAEVTEMLKVLNMEEDLDEQVKTLSSGQKRMLSVGIALISDSKFVILDEPMSGMDPESRRQTWDILRSQRKDRTMFLSTHHMAEAEILGDRLAIMSNGEIHCYGTPMFLRTRCHVGYHLTIRKSPTFDVNKLRTLMKTQIPKIHLVGNDAEEATFLLPSNQSSKFEGLFKTLETDGKTLGIRSSGVSITTMEDVFIRVKDSSALEGGPRKSIANDAAGLRDVTPSDVLYRKESGWKRRKLQLSSMLFKRIIHSLRNYLLALCQILIPFIFAIIACCILLQSPRDTNFPPLTLDLIHFTSPITPYDLRYQTTSQQQLASCYEVSALKQSRSIFINNEPNYSTMDDFLIKIGKDHKDQYNWNYQIGATIEEDSKGKLNIIGFFNNEAYHAIAISLSFLGNTLMQCYGNKDYEIKTINHPIPKSSSEQIIDQVRLKNSRGLGFCLCVSFGLAFLFATFVVFLVKERKSGAKHSQLVSGIRLYIFWMGTFIWDYVSYLVLCFLIIVVILSFQTDGYWQHSWIIFIGLMLYGLSMLPFIYVMSFLFGEASVGFAWLCVICFITGTFATVAIFVMQDLTSQSTWQAVEWIFYIILPTYCFNALLQNIYRNHNNNKACSQMKGNQTLAEFCDYLKQGGQNNPCCPGNCGESCLELVGNYLSWTSPGVGRPLFFMVLQGIVFFLILYLIEAQITRRLIIVLTSKRANEAMLAEMNADEDGEIREDPDVAKERERILSNTIEELKDTDKVVTQDLTKLFDDVVAVNKLSFGVSKKECFGLMGVNGSGKTTIFKILTGEIRPSYGSAYVAGISVQDGIAQVRQKIGYCAQFDSLIDQMTVQETLWMYACVQGIPVFAIRQVIGRLLDYLKLQPYSNIQAGNLSGGNKRKLCVAVALIGNPTVVFLDEPTTGVDPLARRHVWNTLAAARNSGTTIILGSHSMGECESICTRMGILVNGRFLSLGNLQYLRNKLNAGYTIVIKLKRSTTTEEPDELQQRIETMKSYIDETLPGCVLSDEKQNILIYQIKVRMFLWSKIFGIMERAKVTYEIEDYSVGQTTLEQLFIRLSRKQQEPQ